MKDAYKLKIDELLTQVEGRIKLVNYMIDGTKQASPVEAKQYLRDAINGLNKIGELVSIS